MGDINKTFQFEIKKNKDNKQIDISYPIVVQMDSKTTKLSYL